MIASILLAAAMSLSPVLGATPWANAAGPPPTAGRVTVVDVFTFDCINCKHVSRSCASCARRTAPTTSRSSACTRRAAQEHVHANVVRALRDQDITWPVVYDDEFKVWNAYGVTAWPTQLVFDRHGKLRATYVGEGYDTELERTVRELVAERG